MRVVAWLCRALRIILFPLWWLLWRLPRKANVVISLFQAKEVGYLLVLMTIVLFCEALFVGNYWGKIFSTQSWRPILCNGWEGVGTGWAIIKRFFTTVDIWSNAFVSLFSVEKAAEHLFPMFLFFVAWLIGGGGLVSVLVGQYNKNTAGGFRRWSWLVRNHIVVLGWDDGILAELAREVYKNKRDCYVVTGQNVSELGKLLESAGIKDYCIYKGNYDNQKEWLNNLRLRAAEKVFIMGERDEEAHDARVQILFEKIRRSLGAETGIKVNIHDFGLAKKLIRNDKDGVYINFHVRWAKAFWEGLINSGLSADYSLFVVGFGAMGKAIVLEATTSHTVPVPKSIFVTDDDSEKPGKGDHPKKSDKFEAEKSRFLAQFPDVGGKIDFESDWATGLKKIVAANNGENAVIVVSKKRSEKGILCMMEIISKMGDAIPTNTRLALSQEVEGYVSGREDEDVMRIGGDVKIQLFGMKKGC